MKIAFSTKIAASLLLLASNFFSLQTNADVVPIHFFMSSSDTGSNNTVTVPNGKVLIIEQMQSTADPITLQVTYSNSQSGIISNSGLSTIRFTNNPTNRMLDLKKPIRVGGISGTWRIRNATGSLVTVHGLAIDVEDLFASLPLDIQNFAIASNQALSRLRLLQNRQVRFEAEASQNLLNWNSTSIVSTSKVTNSPALYDLTINANSQREFFRFRARLRPNWAKNS